MSKSLAFEEILSDPRHLRGDLRILEKAVRERWEIPPSAKRRIVERLREVVDGIKRRNLESATDRRAMLRIARIRATMSRINGEDISRAIDGILGSAAT